MATEGINRCNAFEKRRFVRHHEDRPECRFQQSADALDQAVMPVGQQHASRRLLAHRAPRVRTEMFAVPKPMLMTARLASCWLAVTSQIYWVNARKLREGESDADQIETIPFLMAK